LALLDPNDEIHMDVKIYTKSVYIKSMQVHILSVRNAAQENVMNAHRGIRLFLVVVNQPKNITTISTTQIII
jgi:hypothetical protein